MAQNFITERMIISVCARNRIGSATVSYTHLPHEEELKTKSARLAELNTLLDMDKRDNELVDGERGDDAEEPDRSNSRDAR